MNRVLQVVLLVLGFAGSLGAQALPAGRGFPTRLLLDLESGSEAGLGFKLPHLAFGISFERPVGRHFELQGTTSFSPAKKYITKDGASLNMSSTGLYWLTKYTAATGAIRPSHLW